ncbi:hypothetical protein [Mycoplasma anserisalpingitidis]|uniref:hypothetical protein n=1 Tax=Mycoplasma anserisalpingitidis TaxID=519450 RepID=UPI0011B1C0C2|nr:hypothetical protein [Mycoplasma anserisalpingitidis]QDY87700.1 hypothetical protein FOY45_02050 [Mycoplasma anserisalpingitidis]
MKIKPIYLFASFLSLTLPLSSVSCFEKNYKENFDQSVQKMDNFLLEIKDNVEYKSLYNVFNLYLNNIKDNYTKAIESGEGIQQGIYKSMAAQISALTVEAKNIINELEKTDKQSDEYLAQKLNYQDFIFNLFMLQLPLNNDFYKSFIRIYTPTENKKNPSLVEKITQKIKELKEKEQDEKQYSLLMSSIVLLYSKVLLQEFDKIYFDFNEQEFTKWSLILDKKYSEFDEIYNKLLNNEDVDLENKEIWKID